MRISDWSSDVCSSDLTQVVLELARHRAVLGPVTGVVRAHCELVDQDPSVGGLEELDGQDAGDTELSGHGERDLLGLRGELGSQVRRGGDHLVADAVRSEEHTSELQSLMRISYAVFCLKKKRQQQPTRSIL